MVNFFSLKMNRQMFRTFSQLSRCQKQAKYAVTPFNLRSKIFRPRQNLYFSLTEKLKEIKFLAAVKLSSMLQQRNTNTSSSGGENNKKPSVLMDFVPVLRPEIMLSIKNWILAKFIIQPYLDNDFTLKDFNEGAKQAMCIVSSLLVQGDFKSLKGMITDDAITEIKKNYSSLNVKERQDLFIKVTDILFAFPYQIGIIFEDDSRKRFAEITVVYHCLNDYEEMRREGRPVTESTRDELKVCNYRFVREYTKGVESDWIINRLGHYKLSHFED